LGFILPRPYRPIGPLEPLTPERALKAIGKGVSQSRPKQTADIENLSLIRIELAGLTLAANGYRVA